MARKINCIPCAESIQKKAQIYSELYESIHGTALRLLNCDSCGADIPTGVLCVAAVLLPNNQHPNYKFQHPQVWIHEYLAPLPAKVSEQKNELNPF